MAENKTECKNSSARDLEQLERIIKDSQNLLIVTHNNPDPDAIASAFASKYLAEKQYGIKTHIAYPGSIGRAENRTMVQKLKIPLKQFNRIRLDKYDRKILIDGQPGAGNTPNIPYQVVIDHHPLRRDTRADLVVVQKDIGVTATILVEWYQESGVDIPADVATALSYAISSETQNLGRETSSRDIDAYLTVYVKSSIRKLSQIIHPKLPRHYFVLLAKALQKMKTFRNLACAHLGDVPNPEMVSEIADFLLRHERIGWSFCTGRFKDRLILSIRSINPNAKAGKLLKRLTSNSDNVGGHDRIAGGFIPLSGSNKKALSHPEKDLTQKFVKLLGYEEADWNLILDPRKT
jgi:nanoRNase/pAp phosphatase (c-di-AMP/oligoRNAs hydrolase)